MKGRFFVLFVVASFLFLNAILPQSLAASALTSPYSITSFTQTNPADDSFWPDGMNYAVANSKDYHDHTDIGDWVSWNLGTGESKGSSGDYAYIRCKYISGTSDQSGIYTNRPSFTAASLGNTYIEFRYRGNCTGQEAWRIITFSADTLGGSPGLNIQDLTQTTTWTTYRVLMPSSVACESFILYFSFTTGQPALEFNIDYLLLTPAQLGGWQHDCSSTDNTTGFDSSTGDLLYKEMAPGDAVWAVDTTATAAGISPIYYPFLEINIVDDAYGSPWILNASTATETYILHPSGPGTGLFHFNLRSLSADDFYTFTLTTGSIAYGYYIKIDWIAIYNIANFTTTITGAGVNDVAYVASNALQITQSSATLFQFDHDPVISVSVPPYEIWNITTAVPSAVGLSTYISPSWTTLDYAASATLPTGATTDVRIRVFSSCAVSSVKFLYVPEWNQAGLAQLWFDTPAWYVVATAIIDFWTEMDVLALQGLFVFAGLALIPVSTLYLVHGGREDLTNDKVFFFLILFFVGCALLIGGIMP